MNKLTPAQEWLTIAPEWMLNAPEWLEELLFNFFNVSSTRIVT